MRGNCQVARADCIERARALHAEELNRLGCRAVQSGSTHVAIEFFNKALTFKPDYVPSINNLGFLLWYAGRYAEAEESLNRALKIEPDYAAATVNLAFLLLLRGDFARGWELYTARYDLKGAGDGMAAM